MPSLQSTVGRGAKVGNFVDFVKSSAVISWDKAVKWDSVIKYSSSPSPPRRTNTSRKALGKRYSLEPDFQRRQRPSPAVDNLHFVTGSSTNSDDDSSSDFESYQEPFISATLLDGPETSRLPDREAHRLFFQFENANRTIVQLREEFRVVREHTAKLERQNAKLKSQNATLNTHIEELRECIRSTTSGDSNGPLNQSTSTQESAWSPVAPTRVYRLFLDNVSFCERNCNALFAVSFDGMSKLCAVLRKGRRSDFKADYWLRCFLFYDAKLPNINSTFNRYWL